MLHKVTFELQKKNENNLFQNSVEQIEVGCFESQVHFYVWKYVNYVFYFLKIDRQKIYSFFHSFF